MIIDHGMGVASLYGHLSSIDVKAGDAVTKGQVARPERHDRPRRRRPPALHDAGRAGAPVNPVEWWDPHWIQDRVERKLREAGRSAEPCALR